MFIGIIAVIIGIVVVNYGNPNLASLDLRENFLGQTSHISGFEFPLW